MFNVQKLNIVLGGGTGFVGRELVNVLLQRGHNVTVLTRKPSKARPKENLNFKSWDELHTIQDVDSYINLTGANVMGKRWTTSYKEELISSRIQTNKALLDHLQNKNNRDPSTVSFIGTSAVGFYPSEVHFWNEEFNEDYKEHAKNPLGEMCYAIEESINSHPVFNKGTRKVIIRPGMVLGYGMRTKMMLTGMALGYVLPGKQPLPWVHICDHVDLYTFACENDAVSGVLNSVAPHQITAFEFSKACQDAYKKKPLLMGLRALIFKNPAPIPQFLVKLGLGYERSLLLIEGQRVVPKRTLEHGFVFTYDNITDALKDLYKKNGLNK